MDDSKTEFFIAASAYHHKHLPPNITLKIGNEHIKPSETIRNLGAFSDSHMTMSSHINNVTKTVTFHLRNIGRIRKHINQTTCHHAVRSLILSRLDYCNGFLSSLLSTYITRLQHLQNWAARLVFEVDRYIGFQYDNYQFQIKCLHNQGPIYLTNCLSVYVPNRQLRSSNDYLLIQLAVST